MNAQLIEGDFDHARFKALGRDLWATVARRSNDLLPYHEVRRRLAPEGETYRGLREVPIERIVGSGERYRDFDRAFLPRQSHTKARWLSIDRAYHDEIRLPPIQVAQIGDVYFVKDGNHRVSVARERGVEFIDAEVVEEHVRMPLAAGMTAAELWRQTARAGVLRGADHLPSRTRHEVVAVAATAPASRGRITTRLAAVGRQVGRALTDAALLGGDARPAARAAGNGLSCPR